MRKFLLIFVLVAFGSIITSCEVDNASETESTYAIDKDKVQTPGNKQGIDKDKVESPGGGGNG